MDPRHTRTEAPTLDAATIVGLLADGDRRRVLAAVELGASTIDAIAEHAALPAARTARAAGRLAEAGLVVQADGRLTIDAAAIQHAARAALARPPSQEHEDQPDGARQVLSVFVREGRLVSMPTTRSKRLVVLDWLAQDFDLGTRYSEPMVNLILGKRHPDTAMLRRYLVDEDFLTREAGTYWRSGGSTDVP